MNNKTFRVSKKGSSTFVDTNDINDAMKMAKEHSRAYREAHMVIYEIKNGRKYFVIGYHAGKAFR